MKRTAVFDTETTGLIKPHENDLRRQPYITEICVIILDEELKKVDAIDTLIKPPVPIDESSDACRITGITNEKVAGKPSFAQIYPLLCDKIIGCDTLIAHNLQFDVSMLGNELMRINRLARFPWPPKHICTVESTMHIEGRRLKLSDLYYKATGRNIEGAHKAANDVAALVDCVRWCKQMGYIK